MNISEIHGQSDAIEYAGNMLDRHDMYDNSAPSLLEVCILLSSVVYAIIFFEIVEDGFNASSVKRSSL